MIKVTNYVALHEVDGGPVSVREPDVTDLRVMSHWTREGLVVLQFEDKSIAVLGRDLKEAIDNATNTARYA